jgi:tetratricopeptide (TPR) repeat protein
MTRRVGLRLFVLLFAPLMVGLLAHEAAADLASGTEKLRTGDYKGAIADLAKVGGKERPSARLALARAYLTTGDHAAAEKEAAALTKDKDASLVADATVLLAEVLRTVGRYEEAQKALEPIVKKDPAHLAARHQLGMAYRDTGNIDQASALFRLSADEFDDGKYDMTDAVKVFYLAESFRYLADYEDANASYREALDLDRTLTYAGIEWAYLFLQKYATSDAEAELDEVFKVNPNHPDAHAGMAAVNLEKSYDLLAVQHHVDAALAVNPKHIPSLLLRAGVEIDQNRWDAAKATINEVLAVNANSVQARALLATVYWLRDDLTSYDAERKKILAINKAYAELYRVVARSAVREHRYREAIDLELEAIKVNPKYYEAMEGVGSGYLRLGEEKEGLKWLEQSWDGDQFNYRTYNTLNLFEESIAGDYKFVGSKSFKFRFHNEEAKILERYITPAMERAFADMSTRYGFKPKMPVVMELFQNADDYSIRTVGLPNLGALGVCFGQVVTAMSPTVGDINWGMVLWHELAHVFAIQLSSSRVPRWFTEGLSEYETLIARPEWTRENDADLYAAIVDGTLPSVVELNYNFVKPDQQTVIVAYYQSAVTIEYIARTYGFDAIVEGLKLFGKGQETPEVVAKITGRTIAEFDADFRAYLDRRLAPYGGTFHVPTSGYDDLVELEKAVDAAPKDAQRRAGLALGHFYEGDAMAATADADKALALDPKNTLARYIKAELALRMEDMASARTQYHSLIEDGVDSFDIRGRLALIAKTQGDKDEAIAQLCAAKKLDPERSYPYMELYELYKGMDRLDEALLELEHYVVLEQMNFAPVKQLVDDYATKKAWAKVRTFGEMAVYIDPSNPDLFLVLGKAYLETGDPAQAAFTYESALVAQPAIRRPALAHIGRARAYQALKQGKKAKDALAEALKTEPENAEALALKKTLK